MAAPEGREVDRALLLRAMLAPLAIIAIILPAAGTWAYWQGWLYFALALIALSANAIVLRDRPDLVAERLRPGPGMKRWDVWFYALSTPLTLITLVLGAAEAGRQLWGPALPTWATLLGAALFLAGQAIFLWAKATNRFFSSVVRIQSDRGQRVCQEGPYRLVRHPGYLGGLIFGLATPLLLGSLWALVPGALADVLLVWRTAREDATLQAELPGYAAYAGHVRWRLLPGLW